VRRDPYRVVKLSEKSELSCYCVVIATGMEVRRLDVEGIDALVGAGVYYGAALTEAKTYKGCDVFVVGGGNSAGQGAMFFSRHARKVTMLLRGPELKATMSKYLIDRIRETPNIEVLTNIQLTGVRGDGKLEAITLADASPRAHEAREVPAAALFIFIGTAPRTRMVENVLERDAEGFILTGRELTAGSADKKWPLSRDPFLFETSIPGVFAAGDVRHGSGKRVAAAVGEGSATVSMVHEYLTTV